MSEFVPFPKVPRLNREIVITEKIDGTNASVWIDTIFKGPELALIDPKHILYSIGDYCIRAGSRKRFLTLENDNFGFAKWVKDNAEGLISGLGVGVHFGEWWGRGIQRGYDLDHRRFSLFNARRWIDLRNNKDEQTWDSTEQSIVPECCHVVPILSTADSLRSSTIEHEFRRLQREGSFAAKGYNNPEGIMVFHPASQQMYKMTYEYDDTGKN